jgi:hypothetical protein
MEEKPFNIKEAIQEQLQLLLNEQNYLEVSMLEQKIKTLLAAYSARVFTEEIDVPSFFSNADK